MAQGRISLVCFDIGGVLVRHCRTWAEGCRAAGLPRHTIAETPEKQDARRAASRLHVTGAIDHAEFCDRVSVLLDGLYSPADVARVHHAWLGPEYEGVGAVVARLVKAARADTAILSNTNDAHWARFEPANGPSREYPTIGLIRRRLASHLMRLAKPSPEIFPAFERAVAHNGHPSSILFLDDLPENIVAAAARGWTAEQIDHTKETAPQVERVLARHGLIHAA
ncbi:MAG: hypothetical protein ACKVU4_14965 [Phycisphaerales bacterium]